MVANDQWLPECYVKPNLFHTTNAFGPVDFTFARTLSMSEHAVIYRHSIREMKELCDKIAVVQILAAT